VREVEEALVRLASLEVRERESLKASRGYHTSLRAMQERYTFGLASILDLEETRRLSFNADNILATVRRERVNAFIALYRAVGGGWTATESLETLQTARSKPADILKTKVQP
jgi:outer membrane protein TolC